VAASGLLGGAASSEGGNGGNGETAAPSPTGTDAGEAGAAPENVPWYKCTDKALDEILLLVVKKPGFPGTDLYRAEKQRRQNLKNAEKPAWQRMRPIEQKLERAQARHDKLGAAIVEALEGITKAKAAAAASVATAERLHTEAINAHQGQGDTCEELREELDKARQDQEQARQQEAADKRTRRSVTPARRPQRPASVPRDLGKGSPGAAAVESLQATLGTALSPGLDPGVASSISDAMACLNQLLAKQQEQGDEVMEEGGEDNGVADGVKQRFSSVLSEEEQRHYRVVRKRCRQPDQGEANGIDSGEDGLGTAFGADAESPGAAHLASQLGKMADSPSNGLAPLDGSLLPVPNGNEAHTQFFGNSWAGEGGGQ
jgi:hypothetical protein